MKIRKKNRAMSLLITLAFIVIITILVVGFAETVRLSRPAAASFLERTRADQFARAGVEQVIGILNQQTGDTNKNWISQPGMLITGAANDDASTSVDERKVLSVVTPLFSGSASTNVPSDSILTPVNINVPIYRDPGSRLITDRKDSGGNAMSMPLSWVYVRQSGALDTNASPALSTNDPIVGRYAYWADDESSKINYNIAWGKSGNTNSPGHPTRVELSALTNFTQATADVLHAFVTNSSPGFNFFNTPLDARRIEKASGGAGVATALKANKFEVTHYNHDPNTTFFNEPRIVLTTKPNRAGWTKATNGPYAGQWVGVNGLNWDDGGQPRYLRILRDPEDTRDPGQSYTNAIEPSRLSETIAMMSWGSSLSDTNSGYLRRTDWPMVSGTGSFQSKYFSAYPTSTSPNGVMAQTSRLAQLAVNVIDYVRAKESTNPVVYPIIGYFDQTQTDLKKAFVYSPNGAASNGYWGLTRMPYITEIGVAYREWTNATSFIPPGTNYLSPAITNTSMYLCFKVEVHLPKNYGISSYNLTNMFLTIQGVNSNATKWKANLPQYNSDSHRIDPSEMLDNGLSTVVTNGQYVTITRLIATANTSSNAMVTNVGPARFGLSTAYGNSHYEIVPGVSGYTPGFAVDTNQAVALDNILSYEVDDPRVNMHPGDWAKVPVNSFGKKNSRNTVGTPVPNTMPDVDSDGGMISDASFYMPPPAGAKFTRADGTIDDNSATGAGGQVSSVGELGYIHTGYEPCAIFNSQTMPAGTPWRTLRLQPNRYLGTSVVPDWAFMDLFTAPVAPPNAYNAYVYAPHTTGFGGRVNVNSKAEPFGLSRIAPLAAVFQNGTYDSTAPNSKLSAGDALGLASNIYNRILAADGKQYGNANAYDSAGEIVEIKGIADNGEKSEELIRNSANLLTARGNVFSVYSIGQALKQSPGGKLSLLGEQRVQVIVERYQDASGVVRFSPAYVRNLTP